MSCNCPSYTPIDLVVNCFATTAELPIVSDFTGQMLVKIEYAGYDLEFYVSVVEGENIVILNKFFNETALHTLKLYSEGGSLLNNTCYPLNLTIIGIPSELPRMATPTGFAADPGDTEIDLTWNVVTSPVTATSYVLRRNGTVIYTGPLLNFTDTGLLNGTSYNYTVQARAAAHADSYTAGLTASPVAEGVLGIGSMVIGSSFIIA